MTFKLLKRRYRSTEINEKLRVLEYFNQPFEKGNEIHILDDLDLPNPLALESLSTKFEAIDNKRGKTNAIKRENKKESYVTETVDYQSLPTNPFDVGNHLYS